MTAGLMRPESVPEAPRGSAAPHIRRGASRMGLVELCRRRLAELDELRSDMMPDWRKIRTYLLPFCGRFMDGESDGEARKNISTAAIKDAMPVKMIITTADGLHGGLSNQSQQWFSYYVGNYADFQGRATKQDRAWVKTAQDGVRDILGVSNFYMEMHPLYLEAAGFGTSAMDVCADARLLVRYRHNTVGSYWIGQNNAMEIDTKYSRELFRAGDILRTYGAARCPEEVLEAVGEGGQDRLFPVIQCVQPWDYWEKRAVANPHGWEYEDIRYVEGCRDTDMPLYHRGYRTRPFVVARWSSVGGSVYGRMYPGIVALPDVMQLQALTIDFNMASQWAARPSFAIAADAAGDIGEGIVPGRIYEVKDPKNAALTPLMPPVFNFAENRANRGTLLEAIAAHLYNREILMVQSRSRQITATEVEELRREKNAVLGPISSRIGNEVLIPSLDRTFDILANDWKIFAPPPAGIANRELRPYFTSELAKAQRQADILQANNAMLWLMQAYQLFPEIVDAVDMDEWWRMFEDTDILPPAVIRGREEVEAAREQRAAAAAEQQKIQRTGAMLQGAKALGDASTEPGTALGDLNQAVADGSV